MRLARYALLLLLAMALVGVSSAQADIVLCNDAAAPNLCNIPTTDAYPAAGQVGPDYTIPGLGNPAGELAFVEAVTGVNLDVFGKFEGGAFEDGAAGEATKVTVNQVSGELWEISWANLVNWDLRFILVKDGAAAGGQGCSTDCLYTLFAITEDQFSSGSGSVFVPSGPAGEDEGARGVSHITLFGTNSAQVAEPMTLALLGAGLLGAMVLGRRFQE